MPGHNLIGSVATLDSSKVTCPEKPGSMKPAVECVKSPSRPSDDLPSRRPAMSSGSVMTSYVDASANSPGCRMNASSGPVSTNRSDRLVLQPDRYADKDDSQRPGSSDRVVRRHSKAESSPRRRGRGQLGQPGVRHVDRGQIAAQGEATGNGRAKRATPSTCSVRPGASSA